MSPVRSQSLDRNDQLGRIAFSSHVNPSEGPRKRILQHNSFSLMTSNGVKKPTLIIFGLAMSFVFMLAQSADAEGLSRQGIFGCNDAGADSMSVGSRSAIGGTFVPVSDAAVTLNTGTITYKECVLRGVVNAQVANELANIVEDTTDKFLTGRDGGPLFPENLDEDLLEISDTVMTSALTGARLDAVNEAWRPDLKRAIQREYSTQTRNSSESLRCSYNGSPAQLKATIMGQRFGGFLDVLMVADPNCIPLYSYINANNLVLGDMAAAQNNMLTRLGWNNGTYDIETVDADGRRRVVTPGTFVSENVKQVLGSGFRRQESANDIDQMVGSLFARVGVQILAGVSGGLQGLIQGTAGSPSYLDRVVSDSSAGLRDSVINAALRILVDAKERGLRYLEAQNGTASALMREIARLRTAEKTCWDLIVPRATAYAAGTGTAGSAGGQTTSGAFTIRIATSTRFSQGVINSQITPRATAVAGAITASTQALASIDRLITDVTSSSTPSVQSTALQQLDALVAARALPGPSDLSAMEQQLQDISNSVTGTVTDAITAWGDSTDTNVGWCNVTNTNNVSGATPPVIRMWADCWRDPPATGGSCPIGWRT